MVILSRLLNILMDTLLWLFYIFSSFISPQTHKNLPRVLKSLEVLSFSLLF